MQNLKLLSIIFALAGSHDLLAHKQQRFMSEGGCSCKISWDCLGGLSECSEKDAYQKAVSSCPSGIGAVQQGQFKHEACPAAQGHICDIARAEFVCGW